jgi:hypothetical protein
MDPAAHQSRTEVVRETQTEDMRLHTLPAVADVVLPATLADKVGASQFCLPERPGSPDEACCLH